MWKMNKDKKRLVESFDVEYNALSKALKMNLVLDEAAIRLVIQTTAKDLKSPEEVQAQVIELLERSIHLNLPHVRRQGPHGKTWNHVE